MEPNFRVSICLGDVLNWCHFKQLADRKPVYGAYLVVYGGHQQRVPYYSSD